MLFLDLLESAIQITLPVRCIQEVRWQIGNIDDLETRDDRLLKPGICFSVEPGIYLEGRFAVRTEIDVCITPAGKVEVFGPIQEDLILIG